VRTAGAVYLIAVAAGIALSGCDPTIVNVQQDGKSVPRFVYEYGRAWPFPRDVDCAPPPPEILRQELSALAPLGTPRTEALRRLTEAGIKIDRCILPNSAAREQPDPDRFVGTFWNRPQGKIWLVHFRFEFDAAHALCRVDVDPVSDGAQINEGTLLGPVPQGPSPAHAPSLSR
jgi:hypothetical protein